MEKFKALFVFLCLLGISQAQGASTTTVICAQDQALEAATAKINDKIRTIERVLDASRDSRVSSPSVTHIKRDYEVGAPISRSESPTNPYDNVKPSDNATAKGSPSYYVICVSFTIRSK